MVFNTLQLDRGHVLRMGAGTRALWFIISYLWFYFGKLCSTPPFPPAHANSPNKDPWKGIRIGQLTGAKHPLPSGWRGK
jgi:hypothetical protein